MFFTTKILRLELETSSLRDDFFNEISLSQQSGSKWMFIHICKTCKQSTASSKLKKDLILHEETWLQQQVNKSLRLDDDMVVDLLKKSYVTSEA